MSLSRLTEEVSTINSVLKTWARKDAFFSKLSMPTAGLVAVLSNASANKGTWNDEYLCLNATVTNATKVEDGLKLTEPDSRAIWPVNIPDDNVRHVSLSHNFTLVASVSIEEAPTADAPLLGAMLGETNSPHTMGILYTADNKWVTIFEDKTTTTSGTWEPGKEYQVALMLQGNKSSVYIDGKSLGEEELPLRSETPLEYVSFCFGACGIQNSPVTVASVFLYNRPLNPTEMTAIKDRKPEDKKEKGSGDGSMREGMSRVLLLLGMWGIAAIYCEIAVRSSCHRRELYVPLHAPSGIIDFCVDATFVLSVFIVDWTTPFCPCNSLFKWRALPPGTASRGLCFFFLYIYMCIIVEYFEIGGMSLIFPSADDTCSRH
ncbi:trans-sialidase [Trypanosoma cruzi]|nr:trans-sialidase [Trypanosoma cruzi]